MLFLMECLASEIPFKEVIKSKKSGNVRYCTIIFCTQIDSKYNVLVPFVVLQELDRLKTKPDDSRIRNLASGAIKFIYNQLKSKSQRLQGKYILITQPI